MKKNLIFSILFTLMPLLHSCTSVVTLSLVGTPGSQVRLQTKDETCDVTLDAGGQGKIKWTRLIQSSLTTPPIYMVSTTPTSLTIPIGLDYFGGPIVNGGLEAQIVKNIHTNDDMTFSMTPSRPSGEPKLKRTAETKQTKRQAKTSSKKTSSKQESKATDDAFYHTVEQGEKLADIAKNYGVTMADIIRANKLKSNNIKAGQKLIIPM